MLQTWHFSAYTSSILNSKSFSLVPILMILSRISAEAIFNPFIFFCTFLLSITPLHSTEIIFILSLSIKSSANS